MGLFRGDQWRDDVPSKGFRRKPGKAQLAPKKKAEPAPQPPSEAAKIVSDESRGTSGATSTMDPRWSSLSGWKK